MKSIEKNRKQKIKEEVIATMIIFGTILSRYCAHYIEIIAVKIPQPHNHHINTPPPPRQTKVNRPTMSHPFQAIL